MPNPRRSSYSNGQSTENPFQIQSHSVSRVTNFFKKPHALPFLLTVLLLITWLSLRIQHSTQFSSPGRHKTQEKWSKADDDEKANLIRFVPGFPSFNRIMKDKRGWLVNPVVVARESGIKGGAVSCISTHIGEIRPGSVRGNHRHHTCNETFVIWGAKTKFRLENHEVGRGYAEVIVGADEVSVAASPSGMAHALVNVDLAKPTYFIGCQDGNIDYNSSMSEFNIWNDL